MQLFEKINPQLFNPLVGRSQQLFAQLLMLIWEHCRASTDYGMGKSELVRLIEEYLDGLTVEIMQFDVDDIGVDGAQPAAKDLHGRAIGCLARLRNCGWLEDIEVGYEEDARTAFCPQVIPILQAFYAIVHPQTVTYSGKLNKAHQLLLGIAQERSPL